MHALNDQRTVSSDVLHHDVLALSRGAKVKVTVPSGSQLCCF